MVPVIDEILEALAFESKNFFQTLWVFVQGGQCLLAETLHNASRRYRAHAMKKPARKVQNQSFAARRNNGLKSLDEELFAKLGMLAPFALHLQGLAWLQLGKGSHGSQDCLVVRIFYAQYGPPVIRVAEGDVS